MILDYPFLPPEINSARMYTGPGAGPLIAASTAWDGLAADLYSTATSYQSVIGNLISGWQGPAATAMAAAATPYAAWMNSTAAQAEQASTQAKAAAAAYETAYAATVPPPVIATNRATLATLVATNVLGQNTPAIAANEAQYGEMWAQDVGAMSGYDATSQTAATTLSTFAQPPTTTDPGAQSAQATAVGQAAATDTLSSLWSDATNWLSGAGSWLSSEYSSAWSGIDSAFTSLTGASIETDAANIGTSLSGLLGGSASSGAASTGAIQAISLATIPLRFALYPMSMLMQMAMRGGMMGGMGGLTGGMGGMGTMAGSETLMNSIGTFIDGKVGVLANGLTNTVKTWGATVSAQLAHATSVGGMSVPQSWAGAAPAMSRALPVLPAASVSAPAVTPAASSFPGGPFSQAMMGALSGRGLGGVTGKMVPPKVIPKSPAAG